MRVGWGLYTRAVRSWLGCDLNIKAKPEPSGEPHLWALRDKTAHLGMIWEWVCCPSAFCDFSPCCREGFPSQESGNLTMVMGSTGFFSYTLPCNLSQLSSCCVRISCPFSRDGWITSAWTKGSPLQVGFNSLWIRALLWGCIIAVRGMMETWKEQRAKVVGKMVLSTGGMVQRFGKRK